MGLREKTAVPLILLVGAGDDGPSVDVEDYAASVDGFGVDKELMLDGRGTWTPYGKKLRSYGRPIHIWTLRDDQLRPGYASIERELEDAYDAGVDGVFADFPGTAVKVRDKRRLLVPPVFLDGDRP